MKNKKVLIGLSGGVDSTASAMLLQQQGYEVIGLHFDVLGKGDGSSDSAKLAAKKLGIPLICKDISLLFQEKIVDYFCTEYINGRTPNPCVMCNKEIKYALMIDEADKQGADHIATGHYANVMKDDDTGLSYICVADNLSKDQSYVLWRLSQDTVSRIIFPLGHMDSKEQIRELLREKGFENAEKKDSQEICFITDNDYVRFIQKQGYIPKKGKFIDKDGNFLGNHQGMINYTIGQRKGLGIALGKPAFVTQMNLNDNTITLGENADLFHDKIISTENHFIAQKPQHGAVVQCKIRYSAIAANAHIFYKDNDQVETVFDIPQRAPTSGQSIVWYDHHILLGGGFIK